MSRDAKKQLLKATMKLTSAITRLCFSLLGLVYFVQVVIDVVKGRDMRLDLVIALILTVLARLEFQKENHD